MKIYSIYYQIDLLLIFYFFLPRRELRLNVINPTHKFYLDRFKDVDNISYMDFKEFLMKLLKSFSVEALIQGNFTRSQAFEIARKLSQNSNGVVSEKIASKGLKINQLPIGSSYLRVKSLLQNDRNSTVKNYYQIGRRSVEMECLLELLAKVMREPLFNYIRTREQLGYAVSCVVKNDEDVLGFTISVECQEQRNSAKSVDQKIESFLQSFTVVLEEMSDDDFDIMKKSIINHKRSPNTSLDDEVNKNWVEIKEGKLQFDKSEIQARQLELFQKNDLVTFFNDFFTPQLMRKLSTQVIASADDKDDSLLQHGFVHLNLLTNDDVNAIKNISQFKCSLKQFEFV